MAESDAELWPQTDLSRHCSVIAQESAAAGIHRVPGSQHALGRRDAARQHAGVAANPSAVLTDYPHFFNSALAILYRGARLDSVWTELVAVATIGALFFAIALARLRRMIGLMQSQ
jgi:hypothetical protein